MKKRFFYILSLALLATLGTQTVCMAMENPNPDGDKQIELYQEGTHLSDAPKDTLIEVFLFVPIEFYQDLAYTCKGFREIVLECAKFFTGSKDPKKISQFFEKLRSTLTKEKQQIFLYRQLQGLQPSAQLTLPDFTPTDLVGVHTIGNIAPNPRLQQAIESTIAREIDGQENDDEKKKTIYTTFVATCRHGNIKINLFLIEKHKDVIVAAIQKNHFEYDLDCLVKAAQAGDFDFVLSVLRNLPEILPEIGCEEKFFYHKRGLSQIPCKYVFLEDIFVAATKHFHFETVKFLLDNFKDNFWINNITQGLEDALTNDKQQLVELLWEAFLYKLFQVKKIGNGERSCLRDVLKIVTTKGYFEKTLYLLNNFKDNLSLSNIMSNFKSVLTLENKKKRDLAPHFWKAIKRKLYQYEEKYEKYLKSSFDDGRIPTPPTKPNFYILFEIAFKEKQTEIIDLIFKIIQENNDTSGANQIFFAALNNKYFEIAALICQKIGPFLDQEKFGYRFLLAIGHLNYPVIQFMIKHLKNKMYPYAGNEFLCIFYKEKHTEKEYFKMVTFLVKNFQDDPNALLLYKRIKSSAQGCEFEEIEKFICEVLKNRLAAYEKQYELMTDEEKKSPTGKAIAQRIHFYKDALDRDHIIYRNDIDTMKFPEFYKKS